jgi:hypothetical protein
MRFCPGLVEVDENDAAAGLDTDASGGLVRLSERWHPERIETAVNAATRPASRGERDPVRMRFSYT